MTVTVGGKHVALFNEEGIVYAMEDACLHAGTSLGMGVLEGKYQVDTMPAGTYFAYAADSSSSTRPISPTSRSWRR